MKFHRFRKLTGNYMNMQKSSVIALSVETIVSDILSTNNLRLDKSQVQRQFKTFNYRKYTVSIIFNLPL